MTPGVPTVSTPQVDILAIAAHRDDVEQTCGGTLLKMASRGHRTAILDLTRGEMGTRGTADERRREAAEAARILCISWRGALDVPDGRLENTLPNRLKIAAVVQALQPKVVILPYWQGRHPDHYTTSTLGYEACFLAGLKSFDLSSVTAASLEMTHSSQPWATGWQLPATSAPHRPNKILYATLYYDVRPTFVVDISEQFEARFRALMAYKSQYATQEAGSDVFVPEQDIRQQLETMARFYGLLAGVEYAEPFLQKEVGLVEDLTAIPVASM